LTLECAVAGARDPMGVDVGTGGTVDTFVTLALALNTRRCEEPHPEQLSTAHDTPAAQPIRREVRRHAPTGRSLSDRGDVLMAVRRVAGPDLGVQYRRKRRRGPPSGTLEL
jgi:hypothetical protein